MQGGCHSKRKLACIHNYNLLEVGGRSCNWHTSWSVRRPFGRLVGDLAKRASWHLLSTFQTLLYFVNTTFWFDWQWSLSSVQFYSICKIEPKKLRRQMWCVSKLILSWGSTQLITVSFSDQGHPCPRYHLKQVFQYLLKSPTTQPSIHTLR